MKRNSIFYKKYLLNLIKKYLNTKKRILNKIKKFNHKDNILKNIKIYELTPTNQINDYTYLEYLEAAINKKILQILLYLVLMGLVKVVF